MDLIECQKTEKKTTHGSAHPVYSCCQVVHRRCSCILPVRAIPAYIQGLYVVGIRLGTDVARAIPRYIQGLYVGWAQTLLVLSLHIYTVCMYVVVVRLDADVALVYCLSVLSLHILLYRVYRLDDYQLDGTSSPHCDYF